jgi:NADH-quinone oxidoreductase subunit C
VTKSGGSFEQPQSAEAHPDAVALREAVGKGVGEVRFHRGQASVEVAPFSLLDAAKFLRDRRGFKMLSMIAGVDCLDLPVPYRFKVTYSLLDPGRAERLRLEVPCDDNLEPRLPSLCGIWPAAEQQENEAYDMVGVVFDGHPNIERILTPEGFEGFPHRKDFSFSAEPVEFTFRETPPGKPEARE